MLSENQNVDMNNDKNMDLDLQNLNLGFDSESEGDEEESEDREFITGYATDGENPANPNDQSRERLDSSTNLNRQSGHSKMKSINSKNDHSKKIQMLEDAKDILLETIQNLSVATAKVDKLK